MESIIQKVDIKLKAYEKLANSNSRTFQQKGKEGAKLLKEIKFFITEYERAVPISLNLLGAFNAGQPIIFDLVDKRIEKIHNKILKEQKKRSNSAIINKLKQKKLKVLQEHKVDLAKIKSIFDNDLAIFNKIYREHIVEGLSILCSEKFINFKIDYLKEVALGVISLVGGLVGTGITIYTTLKALDLDQLENDQLEDAVEFDFLVDKNLMGLKLWYILTSNSFKDLTNSMKFLGNYLLDNGITKDVLKQLNQKNID